MINLFPKLNKPYVVYTPTWNYPSSGVRTLHMLTHALNEIGEKAFVHPDNGEGWAANPAYNTPLWLSHPEWLNYWQDNFIAVYPDIVKGNPLNAKYVVRYLLAPAGQYGGDSTFPDTDMIWGALPSLAKNVLRIPVCDPKIFFDAESFRKGSCFYSHKYDKIHGNKLLPLTENMRRLSGSLEDISAILRTSKMCYLYEMSSILTEAALCGCPVTLVRTPYFNTIDKDAMMGNVVWSDGESVKITARFGEEYKHHVTNVPYYLKEFVEKTQ